MVDCIDAIRDNYPEDSLKSLSHQPRGPGMATLIFQNMTRPVDSLKTRTTKMSCSFSSGNRTTVSHLGGKPLLSTKCETVLSNISCDVSTPQPYNNSQYQTMRSVHLTHAPGHGHHTAYVRTVDIDIVVVVICFFSTLRLSELWVVFGSGESTSLFPSMILAPILDLPDI